MISILNIRIVFTFSQSKFSDEPPKCRRCLQRLWDLCPPDSCLSKSLYCNEIISVNISSTYRHSDEVRFADTKAPSSSPVTLSTGSALEVPETGDSSRRVSDTATTSRLEVAIWQVSLKKDIDEHRARHIFRVAILREFNRNRRAKRTYRRLGFKRSFHSHGQLEDSQLVKSNGDNKRDLHGYFIFAQLPEHTRLRHAPLGGKHCIASKTARLN